MVLGTLCSVLNVTMKNQTLGKIRNKLKQKSSTVNFIMPFELKEEKS